MKLGEKSKVDKVKIHYFLDLLIWKSKETI